MKTAYLEIRPISRRAAFGSGTCSMTSIIKVTSASLSASVVRRMSSSSGFRMSGLVLTCSSSIAGVRSIAYFVTSLP